MSYKQRGYNDPTWLHENYVQIAKKFGNNFHAEYF